MSRDQKDSLYSVATKSKETSSKFLALVNTLKIMVRDNLLSKTYFQLIIITVIPYTAKLSRGKTFAVVHKTPFTGKLSRYIRPMPLCTVHSK